MRFLACFLVIITSCTTAPKREPANVCTAFGKPLDMNEIRSSALEALEQYKGINAYMRESFYPRLRKEQERKRPTCEAQRNFRDLQADIHKSLTYFALKSEDAKRLGLRLLDLRVIESLACMKPLVDELKPAFEELKKDLALTAQNLDELRMKYKDPAADACSYEDYYPGLQDAMFSVLQSSGPVSGTAFTVDVGGKKYLVTAAHVSGVRLKTKTLPAAADLPLTTKNLDGQIEQEVLSIKPGEIDFALDISFKTTTRPIKPLRIASTRELAVLKPGHKFYAIGFPVELRGRIDIIPCVFEGFAPGQRKSREAQMLLYCYGRRNAVGMSGGPLVDETGRVWGMNSSQAAYSGALLATPVLEKDGMLQQGVGSVFQSELCYNRNLTYRGPCTVMPNMFETQVP